MEPAGKKLLAGFIILFFFNAIPAFCGKILEKTYPVRPGGALSLICTLGDITVEGSPREELKLRIESNKDIEKNFELSFTQVGDSLSIRVDKRRGLGFFNFFKLFGKLRLFLSVPREFNLHLRTGGGSVRISSVSAVVEARTSGGEIKCEQVEGALSVHTSGGDIILAEIHGSLKAGTSGGDIIVRAAEGELTIRTSGGDIELEAINGGVEARTNGGDIVARRLSGKLLARTSGGDIKARFSSSPSGDCQLHTSGGGIKLYLPRNSNAYISARTSGGKVRAEIPIETTGEKKMGQLQGQLGHGGPRLSLKTSGGNIDIIPAD